MLSIFILLFIHSLHYLQHQSNKMVIIIDVNAEQEADAKEALQHPTTDCLCLTNIELSSHSLLQLIEHREEPLQEEGKTLQVLFEHWLVDC